MNTLNTTINESKGLDYKAEFIKSQLDQTRQYTPPETLLSIMENDQETPLFTLKSFSLVQGKQKSKKTTALAVLSAALLQRNAGGFKDTFASSIDGTILFFDNEQGEAYGSRTMHLILDMLGNKSSPSLKYCDLRTYTPQQRFAIIKAGIQATKDLKLVIIDGLVDLMDDFMDSKEAHTIITELIKLCSKQNIHISGVLHQNKHDTNARAHIGSIASQKCEIEMSVEVDGDDEAQSIVRCVHSRGIAFSPFAIKWERDKLPIITNDWEDNSKARSTKRETSNPFWANLLVDSLLPVGKATSYTELKSLIGNALNLKPGSVNRYIKDCEKNEALIKGSDKLYRNPIVLKRSA